MTTETILKNVMKTGDFDKMNDELEKLLISKNKKGQIFHINDMLNDIKLNTDVMYITYAQKSDKKFYIPVLISRIMMMYEVHDMEIDLGREGYNVYVTLALLYSMSRLSDAEALVRFNLYAPLVTNNPHIISILTKYKENLVKKMNDVSS